MKKKKINTIPFGIFLVLFLILINLILIIFAIFYPKELVVWILLLASVLFTISLFFSNHCNFVSISEKGIEHKKIKYSWDEVYITAFFPILFASSRAYYFAFGDHYYTKKDKKKLHKNGSVILVTKNRAIKILSFYNKKIEIMEEGPTAEKILNIIKKHNEQKQNHKGTE